MQKAHLFFLFCLMILSAGCQPDYFFDKTEEIPNDIWTYEYQPEFTVEIEDTMALYDIMINIRHTRFYGYRNLWVYVHTLMPDGEKLENKVELPLSEPSGRWYGNCSGDICFVQVPIQMKAIFKEAGSYTFRIQQYMRVLELEHILGVGLRLEKSGERP